MTHTEIMLKKIYTHEKPQVYNKYNMVQCN